MDPVGVDSGYFVTLGKPPHLPGPLFPYLYEGEFGFRDVQVILSHSEDWYVAERLRHRCWVRV